MLIINVTYISFILFLFNTKPKKGFLRALIREPFGVLRKTGLPSEETLNYSEEVPKKCILPTPLATVNQLITIKI